MIYPGMLVAMLSIGGSPGREIIGFEQLVPRDGIFYEVGSKDPFSGTVVTYHANGLKKVSGEYFEGKRDGRWVEWYEKGNVKSEGEWRNNEQNGKWTYWHENGQMQEEGEYRDGEKDGKWSAWYENGQAKFAGQYYNLKPEGTFYWWHENGQKEGETDYRSGEVVFDCFYYWDGQKQREIAYFTGETGWDGISWYWSGQTERMWQFRNGDGKIAWWHQNGQKWEESEWRNFTTVSHAWWDENGNEITEGPPPFHGVRHYCQFFRPKGSPIEQPQPQPSPTAIALASLTSPLISAGQNAGTPSATPQHKRSPVPAVVKRLADSHFGSLSDQDRANEDALREDFSRGFFDGFTSLMGTIGGGTEAYQRGFLAGQEYRRDNPARVKETMEEFGYSAAAAEGDWTESFERKLFRPRSQPGQSWWFCPMGLGRADIPKGMRIRAVPIHAVGFISPAGRYGHLGGYDHQFFATSITILNDI